MVSQNLTSSPITSAILASGSESITKTSGLFLVSRIYFKNRTKAVVFPTPPFPEKAIIFFVVFSP